MVKSQKVIRTSAHTSEANLASNRKVFSLDSMKEGFLLEQSCRSNTEATIQYYQSNINRFMRYLEENDLEFTTESISRDQIKKYILYLKKSKKWKDTENIESENVLSSISVQTYIRAIKAWISWMEEEGYVEGPVSSGIKLPKAVKSVIEILTEDEINTIAKFLDGKKQNKLRDILIVMLFLECGLRLDELTKLKFKSVQLSQNSLTVLGKGQKERIVSYGVNLQKLIYKYINRERPAPYSSKVDALFLLSDGKAITQSTVKQLFKRMKRKTGIEKLHPHLLRHTYCTMYLARGGDIFSLKQSTGHESFEILNNYVHLASTLINIKTKSLSLLDNMKIKI